MPVEVMVNGRLEKRGRDGKGQLVHYYTGSDPDNDGAKKAINLDLSENYRVKLHDHKYRRDQLECDCTILEPHKDELPIT